MRHHNTTKYLLLVGDGMADYPLPELGGKTPLEAARTDNMDRIAACRIGRVRTIPEGMEAGSDVANLSLLGYDPQVYHTGRAPFEAASMGISLRSTEVAFRMNLVTLERKSNDEIFMRTHSAGNISTKEAGRLVDALRQGTETPDVKIYPGLAYRHLLVWEGGFEKAETIPPHDVLGRNMAPYLIRAVEKNSVQGLIRRSWDILEDHEVNIERRKRGLKEANSIWLWGQGRAPRLPSFRDKFGLEGCVISAVDLLKGIGVYAGLKPIFVEGATGCLDTNYDGKVKEALNCLSDLDFAFLHVEAPDEAGHAGNIMEKVQAIEAFDEKVVGAVLRGVEVFEDYRIMVASDHFTPISKKTHTAEPAPFAWARKREIESMPAGPGFTEASARESGLTLENGHALMPLFLELA